MSILKDFFPGIVDDAGSGVVDWETDVINKPDPDITLDGDVSGSGTMTDLGDTTITVTVADDSHNHIIDNIDGLSDALNAGVSFTFTTTAVSKTLVNMEFCTVTAPGCSISLPPTPSAGWSVRLAIGDFANTIILGNGSTIHDGNNDILVNLKNSSLSIMYTGTTWRIEI